MNKVLLLLNYKKSILVFIVLLISITCCNIHCNNINNIEKENKGYNKKYKFDTLWNVKYPIKKMLGNIDGMEPRKRALEISKELVHKEFGIYPEELINKIPLKSIILSRKLTLNNEGRAGFTDFEKFEMFLDVNNAFFLRIIFAG